MWPARHVIIANVLAPDTVLAGKYVIVRLLESGGMGDVYDAFQKDLSRAVAIKLLRADVVGEQATFLRFRREAEAAASLGHPNIIQILDFRNDDGAQPMLVMEKLEGRSLRDLLAEARTLAPPRAAFIGLQILSALAAAHAANIVHRDIKPANVFIIKTFAVRDFVKVLDFGVAKVLDPKAGVLTDLGQVVGTASYMAPEQAKGLVVDGRADLFSVGCILFEALSGKRPRELGPAGIIDAGMMPCLALRDVMPHADPQLAQVIDRALSLDRSARFPDAAAMAKALAPFAPQELIDVGHGTVTVRDATTRSADELLSHAETVAPQPSALPAPYVSRPPPGQAVSPSVPTKVAPYVSSPPPRPSTQPIARRPAMPPRPSARWAGWFYALPVVVIAGLVAITVAVVAFIGFRARERDRAFIANARPASCKAPSKCAGRATAVSDSFAVCVPVTANQYQKGDLVFVENGSSSRPAAVVGTAAGGRVFVENPRGDSEEIGLEEIRGTYCIP